MTPPPRPSSQPADLPPQTEDGRPARRVHVHEELGVPIYFEPTTANFVARVGTMRGRGAANELHSAIFEVILRKIRERALVVPVSGYQLATDVRAETDEGLVLVQPVTVVEYHPRRVAPFVIEVVEPERRRSGSPLVRRIRTAERVYLPEPEHIDQLRRCVRALRDEQRRYEAERTRLSAALDRAYAAVPLLDGGDVHYVQHERTQLAAEAASVGAVVFDLRPDDLDDEDDDQQEEAHA